MIPALPACSTILSGRDNQTEDFGESFVMGWGCERRPVGLMGLTVAMAVES